MRPDASHDVHVVLHIGNRKYIRCLYTYNKIDVLSIEEVRPVKQCLPLRPSQMMRR
jgi:ribosome-interacting GTPase 1